MDLIKLKGIIELGETLTVEFKSWCKNLTSKK